MKVFSAAKRLQASGSALLQAALALDKTTWSIPDSLNEMIVVRELNTQHAAKNWVAWVSVLAMPKERLQECTPELTEGVEISVFLLPPYLRVDFQERQLTRGLVELLRPAGRLDDVDSLVTALDGFEFLSDTQDSISREFPSFRKLVRPMALSLSDADLAHAKKLSENKSCKLYKPLMLFPTGQAIMERVATSVAQRAKDTGLKKQIEEAKKLATTLPKNTFRATVTGADVCITNHKDWKSLHFTISTIRAAGSSVLLDQHAEDMDVIDKRMQFVIDGLQASVDKFMQVLQCGKLPSVMLKSFKSWLGRVIKAVAVACACAGLRRGFVCTYVGRSGWGVVQRGLVNRKRYPVPSVDDTSSMSYVIDCRQAAGR